MWKYWGNTREGVVLHGTTHDNPAAERLCVLYCSLLCLYSLLLGCKMMNKLFEASQPPQNDSF